MKFNNFPVHSSRLFFWHEGFGVADLSDLGPIPYSRIYDDAEDIGFEIHSMKTGRNKLFTYVYDNHDREDELISMVFEGTDDNGLPIQVELVND